MNFNPELTTPCLTTAQQGPLFPIEEIILANFSKIEDWFRKSFASYPAPIQTSVDLRHAHYKLSPVDTNLFPAGFNNLNPDFMPMCVQAVQSVLCRDCTKILLIPENHTRNQYYLQSLLVLRDILSKAGFVVRIGNLDSSFTENLTLHLDNGAEVIFEPLVRNGSRIGLRDFDPCLVLLNNDLSAGIPEILQDLEQRIEPPLMSGWSSRLKSDHFQIYAEVVAEFAKMIDLDPWLLNPLFSTQSGVDFMQQVGLDDLASAVDSLIEKIAVKYAQYNIKHKPFVVVKADSGTYGMGVMTVRSGEDLLKINRKARTKMATTKGKQKVERVILQEGVYSFETMDNHVSEPVLYMFGQYVIGGFYRVHKGLGIDDILNSPGMHFEPLAFAKACNMPSKELQANDVLNRFYVYGVVARLATLAAAKELQVIKQGK